MLCHVLVVFRGVIFCVFQASEKKKKIAPVFQAGVAGVEKGRGKEAEGRGDWEEKETSLSFGLSHPLFPFFTSAQPPMQTSFWLVTQSYPSGEGTQGPSTNNVCAAS